MRKFKKIISTTSLSLIALFSFGGLVNAETTISAEGQYIFNTLAFYIGAVLVALMAAGFCMLESGLVTTKSVSTIAAKNVGKFAICSIVFFLFGYNLAYGIPEGGFIGSFTIWTDNSSVCVFFVFVPSSLCSFVFLWCVPSPYISSKRLLRFHGCPVSRCLLALLVRVFSCAQIDGGTCS